MFGGGLRSFSCDLFEQILNGRGDTGNDRIVEDEGQSRQQERTQHNADDDLHGVTDVEVTTLIVDGAVGTDRQFVCLALDLIDNLAHS